MRLFAITIVLTSLGGCATSPVPYDKANLVPPDRVRIVNDSSATATVTFIRDSGFIGSGCFIDAYINSDLAAILDGGEKITVNVKPGEMYLGSKMSGVALCGNNSVNYIETTLKKGQHKLFRLFTDQSGNSQIISGGLISNN
jgi:hypothetical protein